MQLGQQIAMFATNRRIGDPDVRGDVNELTRYRTDTAAQYIQLMGPALALYDDVEGRGGAVSFDWVSFELPTSPLGIEAIARTLQAIDEA